MLKVDKIQCQHGSQLVLNGLSFEVSQGDICCLLGPSGCGKTTALRAIAGFQPLTSGAITLANTLIANSQFQLEPEQRHIGMVFQDYALFPHLNVYDNIRFGIRSLSAEQQRSTITELLSLIKLEHIEQRFPHELSGGQQQRVALARALAPKPKLLLLDEPFSNLDVDLRRHLNIEIRDILKNLGTTAILVTHDQEEAFTFSDHVGLLHDGQLQQWDTPFNLYHKPCNRIVANFIGQGELIPGTALSESTLQTELGIIESRTTKGWQPNCSLEVLLRPTDIVIQKEGRGVEATITKKVFSGSSTLYSLQLASGTHLEASLSSHLDYSAGDSVKIYPQVQQPITFIADQ